MIQKPFSNEKKNIYFSYLFFEERFAREIICTLIRICFSIETCPGEMLLSVYPPDLIFTIYHYDIFHVLHFTLCIAQMLLSNAYFAWGRAII